MNDKLSPTEHMILWSAIETSSLHEFRNGPPPDGVSVRDYRDNAASAITDLAKRGLVAALLIEPSTEEPVAALSLDELERMFQDDSAWDPDQPLWVAIDATAEGWAVWGSEPPAGIDLPDPMK